MPTERFHWKNLPASSLQQDADMATAWNRLNAERGDLPFMTADAVGAALQTLNSGTERLLVASKAGIAVAMFLLVPDGQCKWRTFQPSQLPLGAWVARAEISLVDLADSLLSGPLGMCMVLSVTQVDSRLATREPDASKSKSTDYIETGWIDVVGSFEDYWNARGKNLRQNMRKQRNKLGTEGIATQLMVWTRPEDMAPALERYGKLESSGWKAAEGTAIHLDNDQGRFYRRLLESAAARDEAVVYEYLFDGRSVALNLCVRRGDTLVILKTTYDETIQTYSPAFLLSQEVVEKIFLENEIRRVEYYGRLMDWHTKWTENKRSLYHLTMYRWPFVMRIAELMRKNKKDAPAGVSA